MKSPSLKTVSNAVPQYLTARGRQGVLLLVVLSMLTLFMMLGVAYVVTATRAREAARAYSRLTFAGDESRVPHARLLDTVLLRVVRGGASPSPASLSGASVSFEPLLGDKYGAGAPLEASATGFVPATVASGSYSPVLTGTLRLKSGSVTPSTLNGRLVTFSEPGRPMTTHRIIRAQGVGASTNSATSEFDVAISAVSRLGAFVRPQSSSDAIINGREFDGSSTNEPWDGFDVDNPFLAQVQTGTIISTSTVSRISFAPTFAPLTLATGTFDYDGDLISDAADNDNDGVHDGVFLNFGLPDTTDGSGNTTQLRASVLIVDLDGRFNVNAHGSLNPILYSGTHGTWTKNSAVSGTLTNIPMGSGYGPADIQANLGFRNEPKTNATLLSSGMSPPRLFDSGTLQPGENPRWMLTVGARADANTQSGRRPPNSRYVTGTLTPRVGAFEAKYGESAAASTTTPGLNIQLDESGFRFARPGIPETDDPASQANDRRAPPGVNPQINYGIPSRWWSGMTSFNWGRSGTTTPLPRGIFNSPPDLHGRMKTLTLSASSSAIVPQLVFAQPEWSNSTTPRETKDDPYEFRLDTRLGFGGLLFDPTAGGDAESTSSVLRDNPYTPAELEPVLRPYDIETNRSPPRLPGMLGSAGEESRLKITTESWDTTAITGSAAAQISSWLNVATGTLYGAAPTLGIIGGEVARGERFDLNRALAAADSTNPGYPAGVLLSGTYHQQRQAYFKDLYTLLMALNNSGSSAQLAQWVANAIEFRDADSRVIPFEYDTNPQNGWSVNGDVTSDEGGERAVVWGAERPEILIREAFAWRNVATGSGGMCIVLHRPWNAIATGTGPTNLIVGEPCDYAFDTLSPGISGSPQNRVNVGKKPRSDLYTGTNSGFDDVSNATYPIWRLRIVAGGSTNYVRFDTGSAAPGEFADPTVTSGSLTLKIGVDDNVTVLSGTSIGTGSGADTGTVSLSGTNQRVFPGLRVPDAATSATLYVERLSDPTQALTASGSIPGTSVTGSAVWFGSAPSTTPVQYLVVDQATITVPDVSGNKDFNGEPVRRVTIGTTTDFWRTATDTTLSAANGSTISLPTSITSGSTAWLPWPNRPFVSSAELLLVPQGTAIEILQSYQRLNPSLSGTVGLGRSIPVPTRLLFDAVHVPTRFAAIHQTFTPDLSTDTGIFNAVTTVNQLSSFREPGRVNLNTVPSDDVWNAVVAGPLPSPIRPRSTLATSGSSAKTMAALLALTTGSSGTIVSDTTSAQLAVDRNPLHEIYTATRLANTVTPRSNVFAIWITLRESVANDPDSVRIRRAFYIVDRSIPVGFDPGKDLNVWDCVRVRRIIE